MAKSTKNIARRSNQKSPLPLILIGAGLIAFSLAFFIFGSLSQGSAESPEKDGPHGTPAPELTLTDVQGRSVSLSDYRGQWVLVNNWATWCPPCKAEMPELKSYYEAHRDEGFVIVAIESGEPADEVTAFASSYGLTFPVWLDPTGEALEAFANFNLPSSYVIDRDGVIRMYWTGPVDVGTLEKYVTPLLER